MPALNLFRRLARRHAAFVLTCGALLGLFQFLISAAVSSINVGDVLRDVLASFPPMIQAFLENQFFGGFTSRGLLAFGWNHPVAHAAGTAVAVLLAARAIAGEIESGTLELHLSQPLSRAGYFAACVAFGLASLLLVTLLGVAGTSAGTRFFGLECFSTGQMARLGLAFFALQASWFGLTLALSAFRREAGPVVSVAFVVALLSYFADVIGRLWSKAAFVLPWSLHHHYSPQAILVQGGATGGDLAVLALVAVAGLAIAGARFGTRDLP